MNRLEKRARAAVDKLGRRGRTTRIPDSVREVVTAYAAAARDAGLGWKEIGSRVGLSGSVVQRWHRAARAKGGRTRTEKTSTWSSVSIRPEAPAREAAEGLVLVCPHGYRVEGLSIEAVGDLLSRIG